MYLFPFLFNLFPLPCGCLDCVDTFILTINWPNRSDQEMLGFGRARTKSFRWLLRSKTKLPKREGVHLIMLSCYYSHVVTGTQHLASTRGVLTWPRNNDEEKRRHVGEESPCNKSFGRDILRTNWRTYDWTAYSKSWSHEPARRRTLPTEDTRGEEEVGRKIGKHPKHWRSGNTGVRRIKQRAPRKKAETASDHQVERSNNTSIGRHCKHPATPSAEERRANSSNIA